MKIAVVQENFLVGDFVGNAKKIEQAILQKNKQEQVDIFVAPEMSLWGYPPQDLLYIPEKIQECLQALDELCTKLPQVCFLVGLATIQEKQHGKKLWNSMALCKDGKIIQYFHKCLLPNYDIFDDARYFEAATSCQYFELAGKKIGVAICEDLCYQKSYNLFQNYSTNHLKNFVGLDLIINPSASPYHKGKITFRQKHLQQVAKDFCCPILFVNQVGGNDSLIFDGSSFLTSQEGILKTMASFNKQTEIFSLTKTPDTKIMLPHTNAWEWELSQAIILGLKDYFAKTGFHKAVLGLSGGIDSALTLFFAVQALGKENITCLLMPSPYSSDHSLSDAKELAENLGVAYHTIAIEKIMAALKDALELLFIEEQVDETEENIQTRIRGMLLMAVANKKNQLLLTTGNKSEIFTGYCTLYGDMCGSLNPLGDLKKTEVYDICRYFQKQQNIFPSKILTKAPSAELKEHQTDQDKLPAYENLDRLLEKMVVQNQREKALNKEFTPEIVKQVNTLFQVSEYKRKQAPPILRVSEKAFGIGWRMPLSRKW